MTDWCLDCTDVFLSKQNQGLRTNVCPDQHLTVVEKLQVPVSQVDLKISD